jgi:hypothetical protein
MLLLIKQCVYISNRVPPDAVGVQHVLLRTLVPWAHVLAVDRQAQDVPQAHQVIKTVY